MRTWRSKISHGCSAPLRRSFTRDVYVFCRLPRGSLPAIAEPVFMFQEDEATTVVVTEEQAEASGLAGECPSSWITLGASSDLAAVGFLAVISDRLAAAGISTNVVPAFHHDHLFVPVAMVDEAMAELTRLGELHRPLPMTVAGKRSDLGEIHIRPARVDDAGGLVALWESCRLRFESAELTTELRSCLRRHGELVLVAAQGESLVGSLWATYDGRRGWIQRLATDPTRRALGIGEALVAEAEDRLARLGARKVNLLIEPDNLAVLSFYERLGYTTDALLFMERWLKPAP